MRLLILLLFPFGLLAAPPNIVLIVSDDQGYRDLGCFGSKEILTPQLDRLAKEGMKLTQFYVTWPACTPSRGSLLTGRYPQRNGIYDMIRNEAPARPLSLSVWPRAINPSSSTCRSPGRISR